MKTFLRACPFKSTNPPPIYKEDKMKLIEFCLESFIKAGADDITFLLDRIDHKDFKLFEKYGDILDCSGMGNAGTFHKQLSLGRNYEKVFFCEDDYLWRPNTFKNLERALDEVDMVSPYDHPAHYTEERFDKHYETKLIDNLVYREAPSNTLTFAIKRSVLINEYERMLSFGMWDDPMFQALRDDGYRIWNPTYSFATHMVENCIAPNVDWTPYLKTSTD
jgi:hypothetical protein